jgi:peptidoglycan/xylan/chitin deacetylase (PgdA/CDA1 family)
MKITATFVFSLLAVTASAYPLLNPLEMIKRAGPPAGQVITKCASPGMLALAYDDGPYQYTQTLVDTLTKGGAKGTFFVTGTLYGMDSLSGRRKRTASPMISVLTANRLHLWAEDGASERLQGRPPDSVTHLVASAKLRIHVRFSAHHGDAEGRASHRQHYWREANVYAASLSRNGRKRLVDHEDPGLQGDHGRR